MARWALFCLALAACLCRSTLPAAALADVRPCYVALQFREDWAARMCSTNAAQVRDQLTNALNGLFRYWSFETALATNYPRLALTVEADAEWNLNLSFVPNAGLGEKRHWREVLYSVGSIGDLSAELRKKQLPGDIAECFRAKLALKNSQSIRELLQQYVPLVASPVAPPPVPFLSTNGIKCVMPLSWDRYRDLAKSQFRIECDSPNSGIVNILSRGIGHCIKHPGAPDLACIVVAHEQWENDPIAKHIGELPNLTPAFVYLNKEEFVTSFSCEDLPLEIAQP